MVVISIIGFLASIVLVSMSGAREKARVAKTKEQVRQIALAMYLYKEKYNELPPVGDDCSACDNPCNSDWTRVMDALVAESLIQRVDKDAWGSYFCYDDNDNLCCGGCTPLYSMGPNKVNDSWFNCPRSDGCPQTICRDDIGANLPEKDRAYPW